MRAVVDLGCAQYGEEFSLGHLIRRFNPDMVFGFDPAIETEGLHRLFGTNTLLSRKAAWIYGGNLQFAAAGLDGTVVRAKDRRGEWNHEVRRVECFNFAAWLRALPQCELIVKMDIEGAEFAILEHVHQLKADARIETLLVEWHDRWMPASYAGIRQRLERKLRCSIEDW
jgi:FkbM family methyltransferase